MKEVFSAEAVLAQLKDFQRRTVDYAFSRMFDTERPARRFLVADEVGLGKTLVAKGLIARTIERLRAGGKRADIIYVCSNQDIAAQNVARLGQPGMPAFARATRLTLLPLEVQEIRQHDVNFISFTPGTTFDQSNRSGTMSERRLIYQMLRSLPGIDARGLRNAMKGGSGIVRWTRQAEEPQCFDSDIAASFREALVKDAALLNELTEVAQSARDLRRTVTKDDVDRRLDMISRLRHALARTCLSALEPDLVILDEFQRFSYLFEDPEKNPSAELARELFDYSQELRVLLLSATPYKMLVTEDDDEDHYGDFLKTINFLMSDEGEQVARLQDDISAFRTKLLGIRSKSDFEGLGEIKGRIEDTLRGVMCRTERVGSTARADAMVREDIVVPALQARDLHEFRLLESFAQRLGQPDTVEYWKSSPYLMNFMKDYEYKKALRTLEGPTDLAEVLGNYTKAFTATSVDRFEQVDAGNPRLRQLLEELKAKGLWRLVWMPPSLPYWTPGGVYRDVGSISKQLIFSAWNVVPDALAALLSYEAERQIASASSEPVPYGKLADRFSPRVTFTRKDGKLAGMHNLMLMFPSVALSTLVDPLTIAASDGSPMAFADVRGIVVEALRAALEPLVHRSVDIGAEDQRWYWVALGRLEAARSPLSRHWCEALWSEARTSVMEDEPEVDSLFALHVKEWLSAWTEAPRDLGKVPADLLEVLADLALAAPGTCALRALRRRWPLDVLNAGQLMTAAARIAWGLRSQFNTPRVVALLQSVEDDGSYWRRVLHYAADGNLHAVLDEYLHALAESASPVQNAGAHPAQEIADLMFDAMALRTATLRPDEIKVEDGSLRIAPFATRIRSHFAVRFGGKNDEEKAVVRKEVVQAGFNSPFWPFVLTSTSVGQEGLDFHVWCHAVVHWNLPSNPVDMEQREGRVHRYKGYAVRKNVASRYGTALRFQTCAPLTDIWTEMFKRAELDRPPGANDLIPHWIFEIEGGASVERRVMALPFSREEARYRRLRRSLALYRMVFAQPRQDDLLACLEGALDGEEASGVVSQWRIQLAPTHVTRESTEIKVRALPGTAPAAATLTLPGVGSELSTENEHSSLQAAREPTFLPICDPPPVPADELRGRMT